MPLAGISDPVGTVVGLVIQFIEGLVEQEELEQRVHVSTVFEDHGFLRDPVEVRPEERARDSLAPERKPGFELRLVQGGQASSHLQSRCT